MKNIICYLLLFLFVCSCNSNKMNKEEQQEEYDNPQISEELNYWGTYTGVLPAADCPGIEVTLDLNKDNTFQSKFIYQERNVTFEDQGIYSISSDSILTTVGENEDTVYYKVTNNHLKMLDQYKNEIPDEIGTLYILNKQVK